MSIRYTGMFVSASVAPDVITFFTEDIQITSPAFVINPLRLGFNTAELNITSNTFTIIKGILNNDNGFMAF